MELTPKGIAAVVVPAIMMMLVNTVDSSLKWRAELDQKAYDRQIRILDKILEIPQAEHRVAVAEFYLKTDTFDGQYKHELEVSLTMAREEIEKQKMEAKLKEIQKQKIKERLARKEEEENKKVTPAPAPIPDLTLGNGILPKPTTPLIESEKIEVVPDTPKDLEGTSNIFSYDKKS